MRGADDPEPPRTVTYSESELGMLEADARYARERASLYRARLWGRKRSATTGRLRQLENVAHSAAARLRRARENRRDPPST